MRNSVLLFPSAVLLGCALAVSVGAQPYPSRPIRIIIPFGAGGPSDLLARAVGQKLTEAWGQQVLVDNRPGANGIVGSELVARSAPDGYTLAIATNGTHGMNASLFPRLPYDTVKDFAPITRLGIAPFVLVAHPSLPARSVRDLIELARARPGEITFAAGGSPSQLGAELFKKTAKLNLIVVPYKGNAPAVTAVISGEVTLVFGNIAQSVPQVKAGRLRALGVASPQRSAVMPDVPTISESGLPGFEAGAWYGLVAPAATPRAIVDRIGGEVVRILRLPDVQQRLRAEAFEIPADTPDQFAAAIRAELVKWATIVKEAGVKPEG
ncbi:MAG TPA: tripartite tricarboxylate transporter substrate binding protein [Burkholderiales bacterium]|nr:tripartite tricarboxylate transporter substrate binding protein [Burkholderiales bacterium]